MSLFSGIMLLTVLSSCGGGAGGGSADTSATADVDTATEAEASAETDTETESESATESEAVSSGEIATETEAESAAVTEAETSAAVEGAVTSGELIDILTSGKAVAGSRYTVSDKLVIGELSSAKLDGGGAVISAEGGVIIADCEKLTVKNLTFEGMTSIGNSKDITFESVSFSSDGDALRSDASSSDITLKSCSVAGKCGIISASAEFKLLSTSVSASDLAVDLGEAGGAVVFGCKISGERGIRGSGEGAYLRQNGITASSVAIELNGGTLNCLVAENSLAGERSVVGREIRNTSIVLNTLSSAEIEGSRGVYFVGNTVGGTLTVKNNDYLLCDENRAAGEGKPVTVSEGNTNTNGDTLMDVDARLSAGADYALLPHVDKDAFVGMERRSKVYDIDSEADKEVIAYIRAAAKSGEVVIVPPGAYGVTSTLEIDRSHSDTEVYAYGVYLEKKSGVGNMASVQGVKSFTLRGVTFGYKAPAVNQVYVLEKDAKGVLVIPGAGMGKMQINTTGYNLFREGESLWYNDSYSCGKITKNKDGTMHIALSGSAKNDARVGDIMSFSSSTGAYNFTIRSTDGFTLRDVTLYSASCGFCFKEDLNLSAVTYYRVANTTRSGEVIDKEEYDEYRALEEKYKVNLELSIDGEGRYRGPAYKLCSLDGIHAYACREGSRIISSIFENQSDDGTNQRHDHSRLASIVDNGDGTATVTYKGNMSEWNVWANQLTHRYCERFKEGDRIRIYTSTGLLVVDTHTLSKDKPAGSFTNEDVKPSTKGSMFSLTIASEDINFDALKGFDLGDNSADGKKVLVDNLSWACTGFYIDNVLVQNTRARGLLLKSSDGVIKNCTVKDTGLAGIAIKYELSWGESGATSNTSVTNCLFDNTGMFKRDMQNDSPLLVLGLGGKSSENMIYRDLTLSDNVFMNRNTDYAICVSSAMDVKITGNDFGLTPDGKTAKGHIYLKSAFNVEVSGNDYRGLEMSKALKKLMSKSITGSDVAE